MHCIGRTDVATVYYGHTVNLIRNKQVNPAAAAAAAASAVSGSGNPSWTLNILNKWNFFTNTKKLPSCNLATDASILKVLKCINGSQTLLHNI